MTYFRERDQLIEVLLRGAAEERAQLALPQGPRDSDRASAASVPLAQIADIALRCSRKASSGGATALPTITVRADVRGDVAGDPT